MIKKATLSLDKKTLDRAYEILIYAYAQTEVEVWGENYSRISRNEYDELIQKGEIYFSFDDESVNGCIQISSIDDKTFSFGLLAADFNQKGKGIGRELIAFVENIARDNGGEKMILEILKPAKIEVEFKTILHNWYTRLGYKYEETIGFLELKTEKVEKAKQLKVPSVFDCYSKKLA